MGARLPWPPRLRTLALAVILHTVLWSTVCHGTTSGADVLFQAGRKALEEGKYDVACQKFEESNRLERAAGTLLNIGNCEEKRGRIATAWFRYTEAMDMLEPEDQRYAFAKKKAEGIEGRVPRLTVSTAKNAPAGTTLTRTGEEWKDPLGSPVRLDPQTYVIIVSAPDHESATYEVTLKEGDSKKLNVSPGKRRPATVPSSPEDENRKRLGLILGGAGAAAAVAGITFGVLAFVDYQTARSNCNFRAEQCFSERGEDATKRGAIFEILGYGMGTLGAAGLTAGAYLLLHEKKGKSTSLDVGLGPEGGPMLVLRETF